MWTDNSTEISLPNWLFESPRTSITIPWSSTTGSGWSFYLPEFAPKKVRDIKPGWEMARARDRIKSQKMRARTAIRPKTTKHCTQGGQFGRK